MDYFPDVLAFIHDVSIEGNKISHMGLSGIGTPQRDAAELLRSPGLSVVSELAGRFGVVGSLVIDMTIKDNHIFCCLQDDSFTSKMQYLVMLRGEGGISLGMCEKLIIQHNRIEDNGRCCRDPVYGIFVSHTTQVDISYNQICNNGPLYPQVDTDSLRQGIRGSKILAMATFKILSGNLRTCSHIETGPIIYPRIAQAVSIASMMEGYAARIHDNLVKQPLGQAFIMRALRPVSILNNQFCVDFSNPPNIQPPIYQWINSLAGAVFILNLGYKDYSQIKAGRIDVAPAPALLIGNIIFGNNQTRLGVNTSCASSQVIVTWDDLVFNNNQSDVLDNWSKNFEKNTNLKATTLRAIGNRFKEPGKEPNSPKTIFSLSTEASDINNTINNQGDHCIKVIPSGDIEKCVDELNISVLFSPEQCGT